MPYNSSKQLKNVANIQNSYWGLDNKYKAKGTMSCTNDDVANIQNAQCAKRSVRKMRTS